MNLDKVYLYILVTTTSIINLREKPKCYSRFLSSSHSNNYSFLFILHSEFLFNLFLPLYSHSCCLNVICLTLTFFISVTYCNLLYKWFFTF